MTERTDRTERQRSEHAVETVIRPRMPIHLGLTLAPLRRGGGDPTMAVDGDGSWWRATRTPLGPVATRFACAGGEVRVSGWGEGAEWAIEAAPELLGSRDTVEGFDPPSGLVRELHRRMPGLRITRSRAVFEAIVPSIIEQKVAGAAARDSYRAMVMAWGEAAPGPRRLRVPPAPARVAAEPYFEFHPFGIEQRRASFLRSAARYARRLEATLDMTLSEAHRRLRALPGVGPWTAEEVAIVALGDADAVSIGDYHLPHNVSWALAGEPRGTDERMLELLEPFRGHRGRVIRLIVASGIGAPRYGPRQPIRSFARS